MRKSKQHKSSLLEHLGTAMRDLRVDLSLTQDELATAAQLHRTYITDIEAGHRNLSMLTYGRLTEALQCALSLPIIDAERSMERDSASPLFGIKGSLSKASKLLHTSSSFFPILKIESFELDVKANMSRVQLSVETYQGKHNAYPKDQSELEESLHGQFPINPFTNLPERPSIGTAIDEEFATRTSCLLQPGQIEYSPMNRGANYIIRGGAASGKALMGPSPGRTYVLSGNLRIYNQP